MSSKSVSVFWRKNWNQNSETAPEDRRNGHRSLRISQTHRRGTTRTPLWHVTFPATLTLPVQGICCFFPKNIEIFELVPELWHKRALSLPKIPDWPEYGIENLFTLKFFCHDISLSVLYRDCSSSRLWSFFCRKGGVMPFQIPSQHLWFTLCRVFCRDSAIH